MIEHPDVSCAQRTGYPAWQRDEEEIPPRCPVCGEACETIFKDRLGSYLGCDMCISEEKAWRVSACFPGKEKEWN